MDEPSREKLIAIWDRMFDAKNPNHLERIGESRNLPLHFINVEWLEARINVMESNGFDSYMAYESGNDKSAFGLLVFDDDKRKGR